ncbi:FCD domain-containing protein [Rhodobacterales bacterium HKCCE2091]|nr:FCD domain-containing protein [Rhodobacterales bacterium HKCCE2091]
MPELAISPLAQPPALTATDQIFRSLYDAVVSLQLPPGTKVSETDIARQLDVSRQPVRDAFFRLSKLGFVSIRPQRATLITKISERAVLDAAFVRVAIEVECLRLVAASAGPEEVAHLREILARQESALDSRDPSIFHGFDEELHASFCEMAGQPHAWTLIQEQKAHMDRVRYLTLSTAHRRQVLSEHHAIIDAIEAGDPERTEQALRVHLGDIRNALERIREAHSEYFESGE